MDITVKDLIERLQNIVDEWGAGDFRVTVEGGCVGIHGDVYIDYTTKKITLE